jgi:hypothetical protein
LLLPRATPLLLTVAVLLCHILLLSSARSSSILPLIFSLQL